jgi:hypothetical protein
MFLGRATKRFQKAEAVGALGGEPWRPRRQSEKPEHIGLTSNVQESCCGFEDAGLPNWSSKRTQALIWLGVESASEEMTGRGNPQAAGR